MLALVTSEEAPAQWWLGHPVRLWLPCWLPCSRSASLAQLLKDLAPGLITLVHLLLRPCVASLKVVAMPAACVPSSPLCMALEFPCSWEPTWRLMLIAHPGSEAIPNHNLANPWNSSQKFGTGARSAADCEMSASWISAIVTITASGNKCQCRSPVSRALPQYYNRKVLMLTTSNCS